MANGRQTFQFGSCALSELRKGSCRGAGGTISSLLKGAEPVPSSDSSSSAALALVQIKDLREVLRELRPSCMSGGVEGSIIRLSGLGIPAFRISVANVLRTSFALFQSSPLLCERLMW